MAEIATRLDDLQVLVQEALGLARSLQIAELAADACGEEHRLIVLFLAYTGLRWGEMRG